MSVFGVTLSHLCLDRLCVFACAFHQPADLVLGGGTFHSDNVVPNQNVPSPQVSVLSSLKSFPFSGGWAFHLAVVLAGR